jgi:hypothetical protein
LRALVLLDLARLRDRAGDPVGASIDAGAAVAIFEPLDVVIAPDDRAFLARLTGAVGAPSSPTTVAELSRDGKWWTATCAGSSVRLRDTKGLRYVAELVASAGIERHALDLVDRVEGVADRDDPSRRALGDAGEVMDVRARAAYRRRIEELRTEADDELSAGRLESAEAKQAELDLLVQQLAQAFGLGGRARRAASAAERARLNVTRAIRSAVAKLVEALPSAGPALDRHIRTGLYCCYEPADDDEVRWIVHSRVNGNQAG